MRRPGITALLTLVVFWADVGPTRAQDGTAPAGPTLLDCTAVADVDAGLTAQQVVCATRVLGLRALPVGGAGDGRRLVLIDGRGRFPAEEIKVILEDCDAAGLCGNAALWSWYRLGGQVSLDAINRWNLTRRFGRAALDDEGDATFGLRLMPTGTTTVGGLATWVAVYLRSIPVFLGAITG